MNCDHSIHCAVTTSWDDGGCCDMRLAYLLAEHGVASTFYIPRYLSRRAISDQQVVELGTLHEIGGHGVNHLDLRHADDATAVAEVTGSKLYLEGLLSAEVTTFAFPYGGVPSRAKSILHNCGMIVGRTTQAFSRRPHDCTLMRTTLQVAPYSLERTRIQLAGLEYDDFGDDLDINSLPLQGERLNWEALALTTLRVTRLRGGIWHLWGHSWEIEQFDLWDSLQRVLAEVRRYPDVDLLHNSQVPKWMSTRFDTPMV